MISSDVPSPARVLTQERADLLDYLHRIGGDDRLVSAVSAVHLDVHTIEIVRTAAELAIARERMLDVSSPPDSIDVVISTGESYSQKLDEARTAAQLAADAPDVFDQLLRSGDHRVVEAALLAMGEAVAKDLKPTLLALREVVAETNPAVRELTTYLLVHGDTQI